MKKEFNVSVIIPTYNRVEYLQRALHSVLKQTIPPDEILVIDDGSTDGTEQMILNSFPSVRYNWQNKQGVSAARNRGIQLASNEWIAFLDSDDEWRGQKLEKQCIMLEKNPDYKICHSNEIWIRRGKRVNPKKKHEKYGSHIFDKCLPLCVISPSSVIIHNTIFRKFGTFDLSLPVCEDYDLWLRLCAFLPVLYIEEAMIIKYGGHHDQLSSKFWGMDRFRIYALEKIISDRKLENSKRSAALQMLLKKIDIYLKGLRKRNKSDEIDLYEQKRREYQVKLDSLR
jgi:glycosyltransferase involved in cell wall biosynthesis